MRQTKRSLSLLLSAALALSLLLTPSLAVGLAPIRSYDDANFTDVASDWTYEPIKTCFELGLMSGQGEGRFDPRGTVPLAQGVAVAARLHDLWRGGTGEFPESTPWYQSAVDYAIENGIIAQGQFSNYTAAATRAQLAGLLALALPEEGYAPINDVTSLPDVTDSTPGAASIFKLYNAGILSGTDVYGTFAPNNTITRAELAAMLCRLALPETRLTFTLLSKPADMTVRSSSKQLIINGRPFYGLVEIGGEPYLPLALHEGNNATMTGFLSYYNQTIHFNMRNLPAVLSNLSFAPPQGNLIGTAQLGPTATVMRTYQEKWDTLLLTLDGRFPMARVSDLFKGCMEVKGNTIYVELPIESNTTPSDLQLEPDLIGQALSNLIGSTPRETVRAIHDHLVDTLTYEPYTDASRAAYRDASEQYKLQHNRILACKYGVCQDYSELFQDMCLRAGIPCEFILGQPDHAWNRVYIDGTWSYVDCTWDDPIGGKPVLRHNYFLVDADYMANDHWWSGDDYPMPKEYDPAWEQLDLNNVTSTDMFRKCLVAQLMQKKTSFSMKLTRSGAYGGIACLYGYPETGWQSIGGSYNDKTGRYEFTVKYWPYSFKAGKDRYILGQAGLL